TLNVVRQNLDKSAVGRDSDCFFWSDYKPHNLPKKNYLSCFVFEILYHWGKYRYGPRFGQRKKDHHGL
ncbi:hypothetical protein, partial [Paenibacillus xylanexedens]|uniref:hypothetical protein n=1 Tax=Paenibacillus xylanexedens TaxID=528191 RepID=UPI0028E1D6E4